MTAFKKQQVPFATALALTWTGRDVKAEHVRLLPLVFDRPTRFTLNSLMMRPATKHVLVSTVWFKDSSRHRRHYLMPQVEGGGRPHKRFEMWLIKANIMAAEEYAVPGRGIRLDASGNVSAGTVTQILSQLSASPDGFQWESRASRKRAGATRARYFVSRPGSALPRGIWRRNGKRIEPVFVFVKSVRYEVRYRFFDISRSTAAARMPLNFAAALDRALATAR